MYLKVTRDKGVGEDPVISYFDFLNPNHFRGMDGTGEWSESTDKLFADITFFPPMIYERVL